MDDFELELKNDFLNESTDLLEAAESAFLKLEEERNNPTLLNEIFRLAHNLKGTSRAVGFDQLAELTHVAENLILKLKEGSIEVRDDVVSVLLEFKDKVNEMVEGLKGDINASFDIKSLQDKLEGISGNKAADSESASNEVADNKEEKLKVEKSVENIAMDFDEEVPPQSDNRFDEVVVEEENKEENKEEKAEEKVEAPKIVEASSPIPATPIRPASNNVNNSEDESIRVKLSRIDKINNVIGELVILQTVISQRRYEFIQDDLSNKSIGMMGKLFKEVQEIAMSLRMLPLKGVFQKMNRIVRDTSKELKKEIKLHMVGEETEVDKTVLEKLNDPLVHIVRNAVDHGIEEAEERLKAGKEAIGNIELFAYHEGSNLVIQVTDDGKGINHEIIRKKAIAKGIISEQSNLSPDDLIQLVFHAGFSTKEKVTEVSGRGVGMDVVKTNIESLGGEVKIMSKVNEGSSLKIILPLTLAIIEGIIIVSGEEKFVVPLTQIFEITQVKSNEIENFSGVARLFKLRGEVIPLFFVNNKLGNKVLELKSYTVMIVRGVNYNFGVVVDDIITQQQIVIKQLGEDIKGRVGIMGAAIMADGMPALILDVFELFKDDLKASRGYKKYIENV